MSTSCKPRSKLKHWRFLDIDPQRWRAIRDAQDAIAAEGEYPSNRAIGRLIRVDPTTVGRYRALRDAGWEKRYPRKKIATVTPAKPAIIDTERAELEAAIAAAKSGTLAVIARSATRFERKPEASTAEMTTRLMRREARAGTGVKWLAKVGRGGGV